MRRKWLLSAAVILAGGCGGPGGWFELPASPQTGGDMFVLDWTGGSSPLWKDGDLPPLDLADFRTPGETLADAPGFTAAVLERTREILGAASLGVQLAEGEQLRGANTVHFSPVNDPDNDDSLGRGHYDPCNRSNDDFCVVYAGRLLDYGKLAVQEWVTVFANICAHEICHNLGFGHVERADVPAWTGFAELMLASRTFREMRSEQRILVEQDTCPDLAGAKAAPDSMP